MTGVVPGMLVMMPDSIKYNNVRVETDDSLRQWYVVSGIRVECVRSSISIILAQDILMESHPFSSVFVLSPEATYWTVIHVFDSSLILEGI